MRAIIEAMRDHKISVPKARLDSLLAPQLFKALCDPNRIAILSDLVKRCQTLSVSQIAEGLPVDVSVVSRHLAILRNAGILVARKRGKEVCYALNTHNLIATLRAIADAFEACCPDECIINDKGNSSPELTRAGQGKRLSP
jgi:DNA-binding transcriptional ArsR family regulator